MHFKKLLLEREREELARPGFQRLVELLYGPALSALASTVYLYDPSYKLAVLLVAGGS